MSKLLAHKEWLTVAEAAQYLERTMGEPVVSADIYRFALAGKLVLSVHLVNSARGYVGERMPIERAGFVIDVYRFGARDSDPSIWFSERVLPLFLKWLPQNEGAQQLLSPDQPGSKVARINGEQVNDDECIQFEPTVSTLDGVWDLSLSGAERLDLERLLQREIGGPDIQFVNVGGVVLRRGPHQYAKLLARAGGSRFGQKFGISTASPRSDDGEREWPAATLPADAPVVVRNGALTDFVALVDEQQAQRPVDVDRRERTSMLRVIHALAVIAKLKTRGASTPVAEQLTRLGYESPKEATVRKLLDEARKGSKKPQ